MSNVKMATGDRRLAVGQNLFLRPRSRAQVARLNLTHWFALPLLVATLLSVSVASADTLIDPTRPANLPTRASATRDVEPASRVTAVFLANGRRIAVLDGRVVKQGDRLGDMVIQEVLVDGVRYSRGGQVEIARLPRQDARVRHSVAVGE